MALFLHRMRRVFSGLTRAGAARRVLIEGMDFTTLEFGLAKGSF